MGAEAADIDDGPRAAVLQVRKAGYIHHSNDSHNLQLSQ
jgi:hypothetical protein